MAHFSASTKIKVAWIIKMQLNTCVRIVRSKFAVFYIKERTTIYFVSCQIYKLQLFHIVVQRHLQYNYNYYYYYL